MSKDVVKFIGMVGTYFPIPPSVTDDETLQAAWTAGMIEDLRGFSDDVLDRAVKIIRTTREPKRDGKWFPSPSECIAACEEARRRIEMEKPKPLLTRVGGDKGEWSSDRINLANELMKTELARQAAREGWVRSLWNFARRNARLPASDEIHGVKSNARGFRDAYEKCVRGEVGPHSEQLRKLGEKMIARAERLKARVLGDAA